MANLSELKSADSGISYSTSEQNTGIKWIDGKDIYQKTIDFGALPNATTKEVAHNITDADTYIDACGMWNGSNFLPLSFATSSGSGQVQFSVQATTVKVVTPSNYSSYTGYVTVRYTKT